VAPEARHKAARDNRTLSLDGAKVRARRLALGATQAGLAERSIQTPHFVSAVSIKRAEQGQPVYASTASCLAGLLGVSVAELLPGDGRIAADVVEQSAIAIMPFRCDAEGASLADGLAEDLITRLSRWWFPVIARTSTLGAGPADPQETAGKLGIKYWVEGSVRRSERALVVTADLVEATSRRIVSRQAYERPLAGVFSTQRELTTAIMRDLSPRLLDAEVGSLRARDPEDLEAWQTALLGAWHFYRRTAKDNAHARALLGDALKREQHLPIAWYALALTHQQDIVNQWCESPRESLGALMVVCEEFSRLYPFDAWSQITSAYLDVYRGQRGAAMARLKEAIEMDPNACLAYGLYGQTLAMAREPDHALEQFEQALRLSPRDTERWSIHTGVALAHFVAERYEETLHAAREASRVRADMAFPYGVMASAHALLGNLPEAKAALGALFDVAPKTTRQGLVSIMASTEPDIGARFLDGLTRAGFPKS